MTKPTKTVDAGLAKRLANLAPPFAPGNLANPGGKPIGARNRLQGKFMNALADDFDKHGTAAIRSCRAEDPGKYLAIIASIMPKELEISRPLDDITDEQLDAAAAAIRAIATASNHRAGATVAGEPKPAPGIPAVRKAG